VSGAPRRVRIARGRPNDGGQVRFDAMDLGSDTEGSYPALTVTPTHIVIAWTARGAAPKTLRVRRIPTGLDRRR